MAPRQQNAQHRSTQQRPFHRPFHNEEPQNKQHQHKGTHINRSARAGLVAPVLPHLLINLHKVGVGFLHRLGIGSQRNRRATLGIGHEQCPRLIDTITPLRDIIAIQTATGLVGYILFHQLTLAAHTLLRILPGVIKVRKIEQNAYQCTRSTHARSPQEALPLPASHSIHAIGNHHGRNHKQIIIGHLHMVGINFESREERRHAEAAQQLPSIGPHQPRYQRWQIGQRHDFPNVARGNDDEKIRREGPHDGTQCSQMPAEIKGTQQNVEAQQIGKNIPHILGQPQMIGLHHLVQHTRALIRRRRLISGHTAKRGIRPTRHLARPLVIFRHFLTGTAPCRSIVPIENATI